MRPKNLFEWFPPVIEEKMNRVQIHRLMNELDENERDDLKNEIGTMMFGDFFDTKGIGNPDLPSRAAGYLGSAVRKWKNLIEQH